MTNNYFKIFHYKPVDGESRMRARETFISFDDTDPTEVAESLRVAQEHMLRLTLSAGGRPVHFCVYRLLPAHPEIPEVGIWSADHDTTGSVGRMH